MKNPALIPAEAPEEMRCLAVGLRQKAPARGLA